MIVAAICLSAMALPLTPPRPQPIIRLYRSAEVIALSGASFVGVPVRIQAPVTGGEPSKIDIVFRDCIGIGDYPVAPMFSDFLDVDASYVENWIQTKARILTFDGGTWLNLDDPKNAKFFNADLKPIIGVDTFIQFLKKQILAHPEIERIRMFTRYLTPEEAKRISVPQGSQVGLPTDRKLEKWAIDNYKSAKPQTRVDSARALGWFESPANVKRLLSMLKDPHEFAVEGGKKAYPVRQFASQALTRWNVKHSPVE